MADVLSQVKSLHTKLYPMQEQPSGHDASVMDIMNRY